ncbi:hypothetical protein JYU14_05000 [Simkania negevensis]|uniref:EamA domain-containing protein n=1 Tax=Simkania negevensis TaxID=83561 RepID=A0ABS3ATH5_9BACT|nr:hypothetical protein [Simkania negevensis]
MALYLILISAVAAAIQNLFMRRSVDSEGSTHIYVPVQLFMSLLIVTYLNPVRSHSYTFDWRTVAVGLVMGLVLGLMMWSLGQAVKYGASALTFASLNSSSVLPSIVMACLFGAVFGHGYQWWNALGSAFVVIGIFWSSLSSEKSKSWPFWVFFTVLASLSFVFFSSMMQWRVLLSTHVAQKSFLLPFSLDPAKAAWFIPAIFFSATLFQLVILAFVKVGAVSKRTVVYGVFGGIANGLSMFFMVFATERAQAWENAMLFPIFSISVIVLSNLWAKFLYREKIVWIPSAMCIAGLFVGTVDWSALIKH